MPRMPNTDEHDQTTAPTTPATPRRRRSDRRTRRPLWGFAPIATSPEAWTAGRERRRLSRAAALTGVMGVAWFGTQVFPAAAPQTSDELAAVVDSAVDESEQDELRSSPVGYTRGDLGGASAAEALRAARLGEAEVAPAPGTRAKPAAAAADASAEDWSDNVVATWGDVEIVQISPDVKMVGFHEGGSQADDVRPNARPHRDLGAEPVATESRRDDLPSMILPGRGRGTGAATAIDIAMPEGREVHSPITGTVTAANEYSLYGKHADTIITIQPDGHPEIMLEILHVEGAQVEVGDRVVAGETVIADSANLLPFSSQIDRFVKLGGKPMPHVHLEMQRVG